jgi:glycosyltransferase involved in cell wall biosynthesis
MNQPKVSVIIPAYNQAEFLREAIRSVLSQTYTNFEIVIVNDASPDHSTEVVREFTDPRVKYFLHKKNHGLAATRNTGIRNSTGEIIALLDGDDLFHPDKLQVHVDFLKVHPDISITYNSRFEFYESPEIIHEIIRPPFAVTLADIVLSYPFAPSEMVVRKEAFSKTGLFDESYTYFGEDGSMYSRLALAGFKFASVDRALSYRRRHTGREIKNLDFGVKEELRWLDNVFTDSRCPKDVKAMRDLAFAHFYMFYSPLAFAQDETPNGQNYIREAFRLRTSSPPEVGHELLEIFVNYSISDETRDHELLLRKIFNQLPEEANFLAEKLDWAISRAYLLKGVKDLIWNRSEQGQEAIAQAAKLGAQPDEAFLRRTVQNLLDYENEFGTQETKVVVQNILQCFKQNGYQPEARKFMGLYSINHAFKDYQAEDYSGVPKRVLRAIMNDVGYVNNRGAISILSRSILRGIRNKKVVQ